MNRSNFISMHKRTVHISSITRTWFNLKKNLKIAQVSGHAILARMTGILAFPVILLYPSNPSTLLIRKHFYLNLLPLGAKNAVFLFYSYVYGM